MFIFFIFIDFEKELKGHCVPTERPNFAQYFVTHIWFLGNLLNFRNVFCIP